jgi:hypothetical protein
MRRPHPATVICGILAILFLIIAYNCATLPHLRVWLNDHQRTFTRAENPALFWIPAFGAFIIAVVCSFSAYHLHFRAKLSRPVVRGPAILVWLPFILPTIGILLFLIAWAVYALHG